MKDFPMIRSTRAAVAGTFILCAPLLLLTLHPLTAVYAVALALFLLPVALCVVGLVCGLAPMAVSAGAGLFALYRAAGLPGLSLAAAYVLPIAAVFVAVIALRVPFRRALAAMVGVHVAALAAVYLLLQQMTAGALYVQAGEAAAAALEGWQLGDTLLYQFYAMGLLSLPESLAENMVLPVAEGYALSAAARADLLLSVRTLVSGTLAALVPSLIVGQSLLGGVFSLVLPLRLGYVAAERRAFRGGDADGYTEGENGKKKLDFPDLGMPPLSLWHLPRGIGWQVGAALVLGYLLRQSAAPAAAVAGIILYSAASAIFVIQGIALINFMQKARGTRLFWRVAVPAVLLPFSILSFVGIFDQATNIRRLRKPREPKEE